MSLPVFSLQAQFDIDSCISQPPLWSATGSNIAAVGGRKGGVGEARKLQLFTKTGFLS